MSQMSTTPTRTGALVARPMRTPRRTQNHESIFIPANFPRKYRRDTRRPLPRQGASYFLSHLFGRGEAVVWVLLQRLIHERAHRGWQRHGQGWHCVVDVCSEYLPWITSRERDEAGEHLVQHDSQGVEISAAVDRLAGDDFRGQIVGRADQHVGWGESLFAHAAGQSLGQAKVGQDQAARLCAARCWTA